MTQPVVHFEIIARDADAIRDYYGDLFEWEYDADNPVSYAVVRRDDDAASIGGGIGAAPEGYSGHVTFYVEVTDVEASLAKAESLGGTRNDEIREGHGGRRDRPLQRSRGHYRGGRKAV